MVDTTMSFTPGCAGSSSAVGREGLQPLRLDLDIVTPLCVPRKHATRNHERYHGHHATLSEVSLISSCSSSTSSSSMEGSWSDAVHAFTPLSTSSEDGIEARSSRRTVRPLPLPPSPQSAPPLSRRNSAIRPLPPPPTPSAPKPAVSISVTPATPVPPPTPYEEQPLRLTPPSSQRRPKPYSSLSLQTSPDALAPPCYQSSTNDVLLPSPVSPCIPEAPTPTSARRKRMSKLRRYLGESVPDDLVPFIAAASHNAQSTEDVIKRLSLLGDVKDSVKVHSLEAIIAKKLKDWDEEDLSSTDDEELDSLDFVEEVMTEETREDEAEEVSVKHEDDSWSTHGMPFRAAPPKRLSKKWFREKGGRRFEEHDFEDIMRALRSL